MAFITTIASLVGSVIIYILSARAANINVPVSVFVWLSVIVYILGRLPISIANLGVREFTLAGFLAIYGVETSAAVLMSMILFSASVLMAAIGVGYQFFWAGKTKVV